MKINLGNYLDSYFIYIKSIIVTYIIKDNYY